MKPLPWSYSSLDDFKNCPRAYHAKRVIKTVKEEKTEAIIWGEYVHKQFEERQLHGVVLPPELAEHEGYMQKLQDKEGPHFTEMKIAFNLQLQPCEFFNPKVWYRGVIDYIKIHGESATVVDYKTGKPHQKFEQLTLFALHTFAACPDVNVVNVQYYWTKTHDTTKKVYGREEIPQLWAKFVPDLKQYAEAFKTDTWQPRPSGLCHGWCPVTDCEFWKPRKVR